MLGLFEVKVGKSEIQKRKLRTLFYPVLLLVGSALVGYLLLFIAYCLPAERLKQNVASGVDTLLVEGAQFEYAEGYKAAILDNTTDAIILGETVYPAENAFQDALSNPRLLYAGTNEPELSLMAYMKDNEKDERYVVTYPRYWHGYLVFTKLFFFFFDFADSRMFHLGLQVVIFSCLICLLYRNKLQDYVLPLTAVFVLWNPASTGICIQYYACFYVTMFAMMFLLWQWNWLMKDAFRCYIFFLMVGICTSYFDFLTYPIATLGLPLCIWIIQSRPNKAHFRNLLANSVFWGMGYVGMWAEKWILASLVLKQNIIEDALANVMSRTSVSLPPGSMETEQISRIGTVFTMVRTLIKWPYIFFLGIPFICLLIYGIRKQCFTWNKMKNGQYLSAGMLFLVALYPLVWFFLTANHSFIHPRLVYRNMGVFVFAVLSGVIILMESLKERDRVL